MVCSEHFLNVDDVDFVKCNTYIPQKVHLYISWALMICRLPHAHGESLAANIFPVLIVNIILSNEPNYRLNLRPRTQGVHCYNQRQRFWQLEFVNQRLRASRLPMLQHVTDLPLNKENTHVFSYPGLTYRNSTQGQLPRTLARPIVGKPVGRNPQKAETQMGGHIQIDFRAVCCDTLDHGCARVAHCVTAR